MEFAYMLGSANRSNTTYQIGATVVANTIVIEDTAHKGQVIPCTTTGAANAYGMAVNADVFTATPTDEADVGKIIVLDAPSTVYRARVTTGATSGVAITEFAEDVGGSKVLWSDSGLPSTNYAQTGTLVVTGGVNKGIIRQITSDTDGTSATVTVGGATNNSIGDTFFLLPFSAGKSLNAQLTSDLSEFRSDIAVGTGIAIRILRLTVNFNDPLNQTFVEFILDDHIYGQTT